MRARTRRLWTVAVSASLLILAAVAVFFALRMNANLFYTPEILADKGLPEMGREVKVAAGWSRALWPIRAMGPRWFLRLSTIAAHD